MPNHRLNFRDLKARVGIDDVAYSLGYRLDRRAGVGRYIELVLGEGPDKRDTIIISNPHDKARQTFFRRNGTKGDVLTFIRENLMAFLVNGRDEWHKVAKVLARFANAPEPEFKADREFVRQAAVAPRTFDPQRYEAKQLDTSHLPYLFSQRGLTDETVRTFAPFISLIRDRQNTKYDGYNIGFPYTDGQSEAVRGYEIRGFGGYKSKAAGTDSSASAWVADLSGGLPARVCFCESAFDAMALYQANRMEFGRNVALVSLGGTFSDGQVRGVLRRFPHSRPVDCFDNDIAGRLYGLRLLALVEDIPMKVTRRDGLFEIEAKDRTFSVDPARPLLSQVNEHLPIRHKMAQQLPPKTFKDWNDCVLGKPVTPALSPTKHERERNLAERRNGLG